MWNNVRADDGAPTVLSQPAFLTFISLSLYSRNAALTMAEMRDVTGSPGALCNKSQVMKQDHELRELKGGFYAQFGGFSHLQ